MRRIFKSLMIVLTLIACSKNNPIAPENSQNTISQGQTRQTTEAISYEERISLDNRALNIIKGAKDLTWDTDYVFKHYVFKTPNGFSKFQNFLFTNEFESIPLSGQIRLIWKYLEQAEARNISLSEQIKTITRLTPKDENDLTNTLNFAILYLKTQNNSLTENFDSIRSYDQPEFQEIIEESSFVKNAFHDVLAKLYKNQIGNSILQEGNTYTYLHLDNSPLSSFMQDEFFSSFLSDRFYVKSYKSPTHSADIPEIMSWEVNATFSLGRGGVQQPVSTSFNGVKNQIIGNYYGEGYGKNGTSSESYTHLWLTSEERGTDFVYSAIVASFLRGGYAESNTWGIGHKGENQTSKTDYTISGKGIIPRCDDAIRCSPRISIYFAHPKEIGRSYSSIPRSPARGSLSYVLINGKKLIPGERVIVDRANENVTIDIHLERHDTHIGASSPAQGQELIEIVVENVLVKPVFNNNLPPFLLHSIRPCQMNSPMNAGQIGGGFPGGSNECNQNIGNTFFSISMGGTSEFPNILPYILDAIYLSQPQNSNIDSIVLSALEQARKNGNDLRRDFFGSLAIIDSLTHNSMLKLNSDQKQYLLDMANRISTWGYINILPNLKQQSKILQEISPFNFNVLDDAISQLCYAKELHSDEILIDAKKKLKASTNGLNNEISYQNDALNTINKLLNEEADRTDELDEAIEQLKRVKANMMLNQKNHLAKIKVINAQLSQFENLSTENK